MDDAQQGKEVDLPNVKSVLPFLGLYSLVVVHPTELHKLQILAHHLPALSVLQNGQFVLAPPDMQPDAPDAVRIFDVLAMTDTMEVPLAPTAASAPASNQIPLSPHDAGFAHKRYWRVPAQAGVMLMMLLEGTRYLTSSAYEEVNYAHMIEGILKINTAGWEVSLRRRRKADDEHPSDEPPRKTRRKKEKDSQAVAGSAKTTRRSSAGPGPARRKTTIVRL